VVVPPVCTCRAPSGGADGAAVPGGAGGRGGVVGYGAGDERFCVGRGVSIRVRRVSVARGEGAGVGGEGGGSAGGGGEYGRLGATSDRNGEAMGGATSTEGAGE
jgi:hypothetical protein